MLGAAAFLIAEFLKISYFDVILMATIPTVLYYFGILVMVELEAAKSGGSDVPGVPKGTALRLARGYWFHFLSLISIIVFMLMGFSAERSVLWATGLSLATSFLRRDTALYPPKVLKALADGTIGVLNAATTCASAGIIVGVVTLTGLGLKFSSIAIDYAGGSLLLTAIYTALIVWIIGLAVPVTASYIICAVIAAPALTKLGVPDYAAHMFIFYYAVLSEVSPPTALSPFAAAAITGGNPYITTLQSWKYTMPAFLLPFVFVLDPIGTGLLLKAGGRQLAGHRDDHRPRRRGCRRAGLCRAGTHPAPEQLGGNLSSHLRRIAADLSAADRRHHQHAAQRDDPLQDGARRGHRARRGGGTMVVAVPARGGVMRPHGA